MGDRNLKNLIKRLKIAQRFKFIALILFSATIVLSVIDILLKFENEGIRTFNIILIIFALIISAILFYISTIIKIIAYFRAKRENLLKVQGLNNFNNLELEK